ncbi:glycosyltransferase family 2 protein [Salegentibacter chungangensis]|uniref:Glycosyltransferase family 2 protein n=1 Tax=Salegentibacter chungangensis TaxID=1335724 RepID=A0ABW3NTK8_9FLAO
MNFEEFQNIYQHTLPEHFKNSVSSKPLVSICVQTFQHANYISTCLDSLLNQQVNFEYEILLGEDNSNDSTRDICITYAKKYPDKIRLFLHHNENKIRINNIPTGNFNALYNFFQARGKYIAFCEGDDYWTDKKKLQKQVDFLESNREYILTFHQYEVNLSKNLTENQEQKLDQQLSDIESRDLQCLIYQPLLSTVCFRKQFQELPYQLGEVINVDSFLLSVLGGFGKAKFINNINPSVYRKHKGGIWTSKERVQKLEIKTYTYKKLIEYHKQQKQKSTAKCLEKELKNIYRMLFMHFMKKTRIISALKLTHKI